MSSSARTAILLAVCLALAPDSRTSHALSLSATSGITIALPGNKVESLPGLYVSTFRRWVVEHEDGETTGGKCEPISGAGSSLVDEGWVSPTTTKELWWPRDIEKIQARPAVNVLFRSGVISYTSVGLDVRVPHIKNEGEEEKTWRNWGMNSQPIARLWNTFDICLEKLFHVEGFVIDNSGNIEELFPNSGIQTAMERVASFVAEVDSLSPIAEGFHVVSFPITQSWSVLPTPKDHDVSSKDESAAMQEEPPQYKIILFGTSEPFGKKLLMEPDSVLEMSSTSVLEIDVVRTEEGKSSQYLPEPYKELYLSE